MKPTSGPSDNELHARLNAFIQADAESETASEDTIRDEVQRLAAGISAETLAGSSGQRSNNQRAMARRSSAARDTKPHKLIFYGPAAWFADCRAGRADGRTAVPALPSGPPETIDPPAATTPYLQILWSHFLDRSEREHRHMLSDLEPVYAQLAALREDITAAEERLAEIRKRLDDIPEIPAEAVLVGRNAVEQYVDESLVRARRQREHYARRAKVQAKEQQAARRVRGLRAEEARLTSMITTREQILATRIRQLHEHTLRRCGVYQQHLVRQHPDGPALIPFLNLALPTLPDWLPRHDQGTGPADRTATPPTLIAPFINRKEAL